MCILKANAYTYESDIDPAILLNYERVSTKGDGHFEVRNVRNLEGYPKVAIYIVILLPNKTFDVISYYYFGKGLEVKAYFFKMNENAYVKMPITAEDEKMVAKDLFRLLGISGA